MKPTETELLTERTKGWTILKITENREDEGLYYIYLEKDGQKKRLKIFGTDLGGWIKIDGNTKISNKNLIKHNIIH